MKLFGKKENAENPGSAQNAYVKYLLGNKEKLENALRTSETIASWNAEREGRKANAMDRYVQLCMDANMADPLSNPDAEILLEAAYKLDKITIREVLGKFRLQEEIHNRMFDR